MRCVGPGPLTCIYSSNDNALDGSVAPWPSGNLDQHAVPLWTAVYP